MYIIGMTGTGKSYFMSHMALQDIVAGKGVCIVDPHGSFVEDILPYIPKNRLDDVIIFDPSDTERPMGLNMLEAKTEEQKHFVVTSIVGLMYKLYDPMKTGIIGPRFEHAIRNAMLTVMVEPGNTFVEVVRVLTDASFVQELLPKLQESSRLRPYRWELIYVPSHLKVEDLLGLLARHRRLRSFFLLWE